jgi:large repetitive protein
MASSTPYNVCNGNAAAGASTLAVTVGTGTGTPTGTAAGDAIMVHAGSNSSLPTGVIDSKGNTYNLVTNDSATSMKAWMFIALNATALVSGVDTITAQYNGTLGAKNLIARACSGIVASSAIDASNHGSGTSTAISSGSSGTLAQASEWVVGAIMDGSAGGTPTGLSFGGPGVATQNGANEISTVIDEIVSSTAAQTASATIVSAVWASLIGTFKISLPSITTASPLPAGTQGSAYSQTLAETGGLPSFTWSVTGGSLAGSGLSLSSAGVLSGTAGTPGTYTFTAQVSDGNSNTASKSFSVTVNAAAAFPAIPLPVVVEILLNGTWTDISKFVYQRDTIQISGGIDTSQGSAPPRAR